MTWQDRRDSLVKNCLEIFKLTTYKGPLNSFQNGYWEGFTAGRTDALEEMKGLVEALERAKSEMLIALENHKHIDVLSPIAVEATLTKYKALTGEG